LERDAGFAYGLEALLAVLGEASPYQAIKYGQLGPIRIGLDDRFQHVRRSCSRESTSAGEHLVEHRAEGENIAAPIDGAAYGLLRRNVCSGAQDHAGACVS